MNRSTLHSALCILLPTVCLATPPPADLPAQVKGLVGARASSGEMALEKAGYTYRNTKKTSGSSRSHWRGQDGSCIEVTTKNGRYASIAAAAKTLCDDGGDKVAASGKPGAMRTVCGVIVGGKTTRYLCEVEENRQGTTKLRMPDTNIQLIWKAGGKVGFVQEGAPPIEARYAESEGETDIIVDQRTFFYISNPGAAAMEVKNFKGK